MAPSFSKLAQQKAELFEQRMKLSPPPINFYKEEDEKRFKKRVGRKEDDENDTISLSLLHDPSKKDEERARTFKQEFPIFSEGTPEQLIKLLKDVELIIHKNMPCETAEEKARALLMLLAGKAKDHFTQAYNKAKMIDPELIEEVDLPFEQRYENGLQALKLFVFNGNKNAYRLQKYYMRYDLHFTTKEGDVAAFHHRVEELNEYLSYFPVPPGKTKRSLIGFPDDELVEILSRAQPIEYDIKCHETRFYVHEKSMDDYVEYLGQLEKSITAQKLLAEMSKGRSKGGSSEGKTDSTHARENNKRVAHTYSVNDEVLVNKPGIRRKLESPRNGPYTVLAVYDNGTVLIRKGAVEQRVNIRRLQPFKR